MEKFEKMAIEMISFLKEWGLWRDVNIYANGNCYAYSNNANDSCMGLSNVKFTKNIDPEKATTGPVMSLSCSGECEFKSYANPEHLFDMTFDGPLHDLLNDNGYTAESYDLGRKAWDYIFKDPFISEDALIERYKSYGISGPEEVMEHLVSGKEEVTMPDMEDYMLDPLEFDSWDEYQQLGTGDYIIERQDSDSREFGDNITEISYDVESLYEIIGREQIEKLKDELMSGKEKIDLYYFAYYNGIHSHVYEEFDKIFKRYDVWYEFGFSWSLTCHDKSK